MTNNQIGKIEVVPVRQAFRHEALDFTAWLEQNIEALSERLGLELTVLEREKWVGDFRVDLLCLDSFGRRVIVENQLEQTDHKHLGQVLTYLVNLEANVAIWVATDPRPEHQRVIDWLNENTGDNANFYLIRIEAIRIAGSPYAPLFTILAQPNRQLAEIGMTKKELAGDASELATLRHEFWSKFLARAHGRTRLLEGKQAGTHYGIWTGAGIIGLTFGYLIMKDSAGIELYIDTGNYERNKAIFDELTQYRQEIEAAVGYALDWRRLDDLRASRILKKFQTGSIYDRDRWEITQDEIIDAMNRLDHALRPYIAQLRNMER